MSFNLNRQPHVAWPRTDVWLLMLNLGNLCSLTAVCEELRILSRLEDLIQAGTATVHV